MNSLVPLLQRGIQNRWVSLAVVAVIGFALRFASLSNVPNGYFHDEAWSAVKAAAIADGTASAQVYFPENNGMDALHVYLIALLFQVTGPLAIGSRVISSLAGSLVVLATYWAAWELFAGDVKSPSDAELPSDRRRHSLSLTAAFVVATLFWALSTSRSGWHIASMTLLATLGLAALFRGRRTRRTLWFIVAGLITGLAQYSYPTARFLPVLIVLVAVIDVWAGRSRRRAVAARYVLLFAVAAVVFAPLGVYFLQNPEWFFVRAQQVTDVPVSELGQNVLKTVAGFSLYGDNEGLHNLNGRPALDPILSVFFLAGLAICVLKRQPTHIVLLTWLIIFSIPVVITGQAPLFRRWTGILPAEAIVVALGAMNVVEWVRDRLVPSANRWLGPLTIGGALIVSASWSALDYFGPYAASPHMFWAYDSGMTQVANYLRSRPEATLFLTPYDRFYEVVAITLAEARRAPIQSYNSTACAVFPEVTQRDTEWVVITEKDERSLPFLQRTFAAGRIVWQIDSPAGVYARAFSVPPGQTARLELAQRGSADLGGKIRLIGFELPQNALAGETFQVAVALKDIAPLDQDYKVFVHLRGDGDSVLAQADRLPCNFTLNHADWRPGDIVLEWYDVSIPPATPAGNYRVVIGLYQKDSGARLPVLASDWEHDVDGVMLGALQVK